MAPSLLITRIGELVTNAPDAGSGPGGFAAIGDAALIIEDDTHRVDRAGRQGAGRRRLP